MESNECEDTSIELVDKSIELKLSKSKLLNEIRYIINSPSSNIETLTLKDVRRQLSERLEIPLEYFYKHQTLKKLSQQITLQLVQEVNEAEETRNTAEQHKNAIHKDDNIKRKLIKSKSSSSAEAREVSPVSGGANSEEYRRLHKLIYELGIGPHIRKGLDKFDMEAYIKELNERLEEKCVAIGLTDGERRLPTEKELKAYKKKRKLEKELEGIDQSNILENKKRQRN